MIKNVVAFCNTSGKLKDIYVNLFTKNKIIILTKEFM